MQVEDEVPEDMLIDKIKQPHNMFTFSKQEKAQAEKLIVQIRSSILVSKKCTKCFKIIKTLLSNILKSPENKQFHTIKLTNKTIQENIAKYDAAVKLLMFTGFKRKGQELNLVDFQYDRVFEIQKMANSAYMIASMISNFIKSLI